MIDTSPTPTESLTALEWHKFCQLCCDNCILAKHDTPFTILREIYEKILNRPEKEESFDLETKKDTKWSELPRADERNENNQKKEKCSQINNSGNVGYDLLTFQQTRGVEARQDGRMGGDRTPARGIEPMTGWCGRSSEKELAKHKSNACKILYFPHTYPDPVQVHWGRPQWQDNL